MDVFIFIIGVVLLSVYVLLSFIKPFEAVYVALVIKPVLDMSYNIGAAGITLSRLMATLMVGHFIVFILLNMNRLNTIVLRLLIFLLLVMAFFSYAIIGINDIMMGVESLLRYMNFLLPFLAMPFVIKRDEERFFQILMIASFLPITISLLQILNIPIGNYENTIGGLVRPRGFFHDIFTNRLYFLYGMVGSTYFLLKGSKKKITKWLSFGYFSLSVVCTFCLSSKSGYFTILIFLFFIILNLKIPYKLFINLVFVAFLTVPLILSSNRLITVYQKEINFIVGHEKMERLFQGRVFGWIEAINDWKKSSLLKQFFGQGEIASGMHNDFLRILFANGLIGLFLYIVFLFSVFIILFYRYCLYRKFEYALSLSLLFVFCIDSIGLVPTLYPAYNWMVWGIVSYSMVKFDSQNSSFKTRVITQSNN